MGWLKFAVPEVYTKSYDKNNSRWSIHDLWKALTSEPYAIGALIVNNCILTTVFVDGIDQVSINRVDHYYPVVARRFRPITQVGFVRTIPQVKDVSVPPYGLFMDQNKYVSLRGLPPVAIRDAIPAQDISLYKQLISTDHYAIYMTEEGPKYLDL